MSYEEPPLDSAEADDGEGDWEDVAPPGAEPDDGEDDDGEDDDGGEFDDFADIYYGE